jgi:hypothetical protein
MFGLLVIAGSAGAFVAPPFTASTRCRRWASLLLSLGVLLEDCAMAVAGILVGAVAIVLEIALGAAAIHGLRTIL